MGLKGYRLWVMGQLDSTCRAPPRGDGALHGDASAQDALEAMPRVAGSLAPANHAVAAQDYAFDESKD
jgi:hypothetical protein